MQFSRTKRLRIGSRFLCIHSIYRGRIGTVVGSRWSALAYPPGWIYDVTFGSKKKKDPQEFHEDYVVPISENCTVDQIMALEHLCDLQKNSEV